MMLLGVTIFVLEPYQLRTANISGTLLGFYLALGSVQGADLDFVISASDSIQLGSIVIVFSTIPHCVFYGYIIYHVIKGLRHYATTLRGEENILHRLVVNRDS